MAVTATTFVARFPEFGNIETSVVTATVAEADVSVTVTWGETSTTTWSTI